jgi:hypothetical protein
MNNEDFEMSPALDRELNEALVNADISNSYEEFLAIFDRYYAEDVEVASVTTPVPLTGKANVLPRLFNFLAPLHVMAEIGGLSVTLRYSPIRADHSEAQYAEWSLDLQGILGRSVTVHWSSVRRWDGSRVIYERHFDHRQIGGPLTLIDLDVGGSVRRNLSAKPS